ncbi:hypothetical protein VNO80_03961 [Phaseolus coccineus]|uniref:Uncharacterized protein n=1 Tax=Phaseolus coccineus TaxID=3886 RepID=A0AAN9NXV1_PHACN
MDIQTPDKLAEFSKINKTVSNAMDCHASKVTTISYPTHSVKCYGLPCKQRSETRIIQIRSNIYFHGNQNRVIYLFNVNDNPNKVTKRRQL